MLTVEMQMIQSVNSLSIWILILVQYVMVHDKIYVKMECEYWHSFMKNNRCTYVPIGKGCFFIWAGLSHHDVCGTFTNGELFVGVLKVA
jgi:hypothetical protein